jgi:preprotein translocase subunit SecY
MWEKISQIWKIRDLRNSLLFVLAMLVLIRVAAHIPVPGVNLENLRDFFRSNQIFGFVSVFSGGTMESFSVVALGVGPYITSSIIFQLLAMIIPRLEEMQKEGESGQARINQYTRLLTVPLAALQAYGMIHILQASQRNIISDMSPMTLATIIMTLTAGTVFMMWLGELISERKVGNGISILICTGIISGVPTAIQQAAAGFDTSQVVNWLAFAAIGLVTVAGVVFITEGQRNLPVTYAKRVRGAGMFGGVETHLPLRVNMAGVIPIIFAISIVLLPTMVGQFFMQAKTPWIANGAEAVIRLFSNSWFYGITYFVMVFLFTYFYTAVVFHPDRVAENLQKQGGFVPGVRPGPPTAEFIQRTVNRIIPAGALFLATIAVLPLMIQRLTGTQALVIGGTGLLIVVSVIIEVVNQINAQLTMREYETL